jgi:hypothetical protein
VKSIQFYSSSSRLKTFLSPVQSIWYPTNPLSDRKHQFHNTFVYNGLTTLVLNCEITHVSLGLIPSTLTSLDVQCSNVYEVLMPYFTAVQGLPPTPLGILFPKLSTLAICSTYRRRILGLTIRPFHYPSKQDFFSNIPQTLTSLHYDHFTLKQTMKRVSNLPPNLIRLGINSSRILPHISLLTALPICHQLVYLSLPQTILSEDPQSVLCSLSNLEHLAVQAINLSIVTLLPKTLTKLTVWASIAIANEIMLPWPTTLVHFEIFFQRSNLESYYLPLHMQSYRQNNPHFKENMLPLSCDFFVNIENYTSLVSLDFPLHKLFDEVLLMLPSSIRKVNVLCIQLTGRLYVEGKVPATWSPKKIIESAHTFFSSHPNRIITFSDLEGLIVDVQAVIPPGVTKLKDIPIVESAELQLPSSLTMLPKSYIPTVPYLSKLPAGLTLMDCTHFNISPEQISLLPKSLKKMALVNWELTHFSGWKDLFASPAASQLTTLSIPKDLASLLQKHYLPDIKFKYGTRINPDWEGRSVNYIPPSLTRLIVYGNRYWPLINKHDFPRSLSILELDDELTIGPESSYSSSSSSSTSHHHHHHQQQQHKSTGCRIKRLLELVPTITHLILTGKAATTFLSDFGSDPSLTLPHLEILIFKPPYSSSDSLIPLNRMAPNLKTLELSGWVTFDRSGQLENLIPPNLTSLVISSADIDYDACQYLPTTLTSLTVSKTSKRSAADILGRLKSM